MKTIVNDKVYKVKTSFGEYNVTPLLHSYHYGGGIAVELFDVDDCEPFAVITVNLSDSDCDKDCAFVDTNNCPWVTKFLVEHKLAEPTGNYGSSGFCVYPEYKFDLKKFVDERSR